MIEQSQRQKIIDQIIGVTLPAIQLGVVVELYTGKLYTFKTDIGSYVILREPASVELDQLPRIEIDDFNIATSEPKDIGSNLNRLPITVYVAFKAGCEELEARAAIADLYAAFGVDPHLTNATGQRLTRWVEPLGDEMAKAQSGDLVTAVKIEVQVEYVTDLFEQ